MNLNFHDIYLSKLQKFVRFTDLFSRISSIRQHVSQSSKLTRFDLEQLLNSSNLISSNLELIRNILTKYIS